MLAYKCIEKDLYSRRFAWNKLKFLLELLRNFEFPKAVYCHCKALHFK